MPGSQLKEKMFKCLGQGHKNKENRENVIYTVFFLIELNFIVEGLSVGANFHPQPHSMTELQCASSILNITFFFIICAIEL